MFVAPKGELAKGLSWAEVQWAEAVKDHRTHEYSWKDIIMDAAKFIGWHVVLKQPVGEWDCSDFVTRYLLAANAAGPLGELAKDPSTVSPNDLGRAFHVS